MRLQPRSLPLLCQVLALAVTACVPIDGPPPLQPEAFRFDGRLYHLAELSGMVVPFDALSPIGQAEPLDGTKALAVLGLAGVVNEIT